MLKENPHKVSQDETNHICDAADGLTVELVVLQAANGALPMAVKCESTIVLTRRESLRLLELMENPPPRNERFLEAQARYRRKMNEADPTTEEHLPPV